MACLLNDRLSLQGPQFEPVCQESEACIDATRKGLQGHAFSPQGVCRCSGYSNGGPLLPNVEVRDGHDSTTATTTVCFHRIRNLETMHD